MAIPNEAGGARIATAYFLLRAFTSLLGLGAVGWGTYAFPLFWQQAPFNRAASALLQGRTFPTKWLWDVARQADDAAEQSLFCNPTLLHDALVLRVAVLNEAIKAANRVLVASAYGPLYDATRRSLSCAPADAFAWLALFWLDVSKRGSEPGNTTYLRLSYTLGPNEGWVALWRSRLAFAQFERLPKDLADDAIHEFIKLVDTGQLYPETSEIFANAAAALQSRIVADLKTAKIIPRQNFARALDNRGLDVKIPGVERPDARPWR